MEKSTGFRAVQLGRRKICLFWQVMDSIDKNGGLASKLWGVGHDLSGAVRCQSRSNKQAGKLRSRFNFSNNGKW
jgi:hypothetical protein